MFCTFTSPANFMFIIYFWMDTRSQHAYFSLVPDVASARDVMNSWRLKIPGSWNLEPKLLSTHFIFNKQKSRKLSSFSLCTYQILLPISRGLWSLTITFLGIRKSEIKGCLIEFFPGIWFKKRASSRALDEQSQLFNATYRNIVWSFCDMLKFMKVRPTIPNILKKKTNVCNILCPTLLRYAAWKCGIV